MQSADSIFPVVYIQLASSACSMYLILAGGPLELLPTGALFFSVQHLTESVSVCKDYSRKADTRSSSFEGGLWGVGVGFEKIFDSKFENFCVFRIFLLSKIVSNSNRIFLDICFESFKTNIYLVRRVTYLSSCLAGLTVDSRVSVYLYVHDYSTYEKFDSIRIINLKTNQILAF